MLSEPAYRSESKFGSGLPKGKNDTLKQPEASEDSEGFVQSRGAGSSAKALAFVARSKINSLRNKMNRGQPAL